MKIYGETIFDIIYLIIAIFFGINILIKSKNKTQKLIGLSILILGCGDAFHLIPRILNGFTNKNLDAYLGIGKLVTSITMTIFYIFMYYIYLLIYKEKENKNLTTIIIILSFIRIILCLFPQNDWLTNNSPLIWGIIRNIPFIILGIVLIILFFNKRKENSTLKPIWLYMTLSFMFYIPVVIGTKSIPILGMLMLPKTICYILIIMTFKKYIKQEVEENKYA